MKFRDLVGMCLRNLFRRRTRTILAITGVVVGTCAIVVMLSIGFGLSASYQEEISSYGNLHMITLYNYNGTNQYGSSSQNEKGVISDKALADIAKIDGVTAVTPVESLYMYFQVGKYVTSCEVKGVDLAILEKFNYAVSEGRMLKTGDKNCVVFGNYVPQWFYNPSSKHYDNKPQDVVDTKMIMTADWSIGQNLSAEDEKNVTHYEQFEVKGVGLLDVTGDYNADYNAFMDIAEVQKVITSKEKSDKSYRPQSGGNKTYTQAMIYIEDLDKVEKIYNRLQDDGFMCDSPISWLAEFNKIANMIELILGGIGGISLFVAALSIANTMIMSIYERTREIGVMKVIGANLRDIKRMFLMEAGMIGFIGGVVGVAISLLLSLLMNTVLKDTISMLLQGLGGGGSTISVIPLWLILSAVVFATFIGVVAGYSPAKRAMNLSALESLRNE